MELPKKIPDAFGKLKVGMESKARELNVEEVLRQAMKVPVAKVDREKFLIKELKNKYSAHTLEMALANNPAYAGISRDEIDKIAKHVINYETNKVSAISFATGIPGGVAMAATVSADVLQYSTFILRVMQKLAYLYGFEKFELDEEDIDDETMNRVLMFLGIMFGVQEANVATKIIARMATQNVAKKLTQKPLTKGLVYPIVKNIAKAVGAKMTKQIFANGVSKVVPVIGGFVTGGLTFVTFKPCAINLKNALRDLPVSDPEFYRSGEYLKQDEEPVIPDAEDAVFYSIDPDDDEQTGENIKDSQSTPRQYTS